MIALFVCQLNVDRAELEYAISILYLSIVVNDDQLYGLNLV